MLYGCEDRGPRHVIENPIGVSLWLPGGVDSADLRGEVGALVVYEREKRGDHGEDGKKTNEGRCDGRDGLVERPEEDEHSSEEEC